MRPSFGHALVVNELAVLPWRSVAAGVAVGASLLGLDASGLVVGGPGSVAMWLGLAALGGAAAFTLDDASAAVTSAAPVRPVLRLVARLLVPTLLLGVWMTYAAVVTGDRDAGLSMAALAVTGAGVLLLSLGAASFARSAGMPEPGAVVALAILLAVLVGLALPFLPGRLHVLLAGEVPGRELMIWAVLIVVQLVGLGRAGADPWRSRRRLGSLRP
ncbi:MAG: hypothetical protein ABJA74_07315 [Lapillicoccus sp.]